MASVNSYAYQSEHEPVTQAETTAYFILAEYAAPPEIMFKEWYLTSYSAVRQHMIFSNAKFPVEMLLGSRADGLSIPDVLPLSGPSMLLSDYDKMTPTWRLANSSGVESAIAADSITLEPVAADPRYFRLLPRQEKRNEVLRRHSSYDGSYLPNRHFVDPQGQGMAETRVSVHGPAVRMINGLPTILHQQDTVKSIQLDTWPAAIAADWLRRVRPSGWPGERMARGLVDSEPLFLTPVGRPGSPDESIEWRLSFSLPERQLALSLTAAQRTAYVLVKMLMKAQSEGSAGGGGGGAAVSFRTFYLKNALFWACETEPADAWRRPADGARILLAHVERYATDARLPSYFVPASNLLDHELAEALRPAAVRARHLRERPLDVLRLVATPRRSFLSLGIVDYEPLWRWVDAETAAASAAEPVASADLQANAQTSSSARLVELSSPSQAPVSDVVRTLTFLFDAYAGLLKRTERSLEASVGNRGLCLIARVTRGVIAAVASRLAVDIYCGGRSQYLASLGGGRYVLSRESNALEAFVRSLLEEHGIARGEDVVLHSRALLRIRLRGSDEMSSGSFVPVTESNLRLTTAQCALTQPIENIAEIVMNEVSKRGNFLDSDNKLLK